MTRVVSSTISTAVDQAVTKPVYLIRMGWVVEVRSCTWAANITWNAETWTASGLSIKSLDSDGAILTMPLGDSDPWLDLVVDENQRNRTIQIYEHQTDYTASPVVSDAVLIFEGFMDQAVIGNDIRVTVIENKKHKSFPPTTIDRPIYNWLLTTGTKIVWRGGIIEAE
jgi:hypothetical protein